MSGWLWTYNSPPTCASQVVQLHMCAIKSRYLSFSFYFLILFFFCLLRHGFMNLNFVKDRRRLLVLLPSLHDSGMQVSTILNLQDDWLQSLWVRHILFLLCYNPSLPFPFFFKAPTGQPKIICVDHITIELEWFTVWKLFVSSFSTFHQPPITKLCWGLFVLKNLWGNDLTS